MPRVSPDPAAAARHVLLGRVPMARASALPLHAQCRERLLEQIEGGDLGPGARPRRVLLIERLGLLDREPVAHLAAYLAPRAATGLTARKLEGASLYELLADQGIQPQRADSTIEVVRAVPAQAALLGLERG